MPKDTIGTNAGQWYAEVGKLESGRQPRFYLGRLDEVTKDEARFRRQRVRQFWQKFVEHNRLNGYPIVPSPSLASLLTQAWSDRALRYAKQIGKGATRLVFDDPGTDAMLLDSLADLNDHYDGIVLFVPSDDLRERVATVGNQHRATATAAAKATQAAEPTANGPTVHFWMTKYAEYAKRAKQAFDADTGRNDTTEWGHTYARQVEALKRFVRDIPLPRLDYSAIEAVVIEIANRPVRKRTGKPISKPFASSLLKAWKSFIRWLPKQRDANWSKPEDWDEAFDHRPRKNNVEKAVKPIGRVKAYTVGELDVLYQYATPFERVLLLLSLNCGFGAIEIAGLLWQDCHLSRADDGYIKRVRLKNEEGVYGEHWLYPQTVQALEWAQGRTSSVLKRSLTPADRVLLGAKGERLVRLTAKGNRSNKVAAAWTKLTERVQRDRPDFPTLSFGKLRKTAGNLVKSFSDGETVAVFHQRSSAVATDDEAEVYTDRDYERVFAAQRKVFDTLKPMLDGVAQPFDGKAKMYTSRVVTDRIAQLWRDGLPPKEIVKVTGKSRATVYRFRPVSASTAQHSGRPGQPEFKSLITG